MRVHSFHHTRVCDEEVIDQKTQSGADEGYLLVAEEPDDGFLVGGEVSVERKDLGVRIVDDLFEEIGCRVG